MRWSPREVAVERLLEQGLAHDAAVDPLDARIVGADRAGHLARRSRGFPGRHSAVRVASRSGIEHASRPAR